MKTAHGQPANKTEKRRRKPKQTDDDGGDDHLPQDSLRGACRFKDSEPLSERLVEVRHQPNVDDQGCAAEHYDPLRVLRRPRDSSQDGDRRQYQSSGARR